MENLEKLGVRISLNKPATIADIIMRGGAKIKLCTPLQVGDFQTIWDAKKRKIKIITIDNSFACIDKRHVVFYHVQPVAK